MCIINLSDRHHIFTIGSSLLALLDSVTIITTLDTTGYASHQAYFKETEIMLPALLTIILILIVLALLPYDRPAPVFEDDDL